MATPGDARPGATIAIGARAAVSIDEARAAVLEYAGVLVSMLNVDALALVPAGCDRRASGEQVEIELFG